MRAMGMASGLSMAAVQDRIDVLFEPEVDEIGFLDFYRYEELVECGAEHAREVLGDASVQSVLAPYEPDAPAG